MACSKRSQPEAQPVTAEARTAVSVYGAKTSKSSDILFWIANEMNRSLLNLGPILLS